ncbi:MAG: 16S rRNA (guanine(527)-N(7))-methyltransferase RsmG [Treponema sp.]|nr:16S rRNA (guanine(527)-N(7))-methyltransferase RsmG [Treponema sp.]
MNLLTQGLEKVGIPSEQIEALAEKMEAYIKEIILFNSAYNLTNTSDHDELVTRHILDSLSAYKEIAKLIEERRGGKVPSSEGALPGEEASSAAVPPAGTVPPAGPVPPTGTVPPLLLADIGSGGGLPGIPLAAAFLPDPNLHFELVERMEKRCAFLENCAAILGLKNVTVVNSEAERLEEASYDLISFRAFRPLDKKMTKTLLRIVKPEGYLCAYKAKLENITEEMAGIKEQVPEYRVEKLFVPGMEASERNLVIIEK